MNLEIRLAIKNRDVVWLKRRLHDLGTYLEDPYLPKFLKRQVEELIKLIEMELKNR